MVDGDAVTDECDVNVDVSDIESGTTLDEAVVEQAVKSGIQMQLMRGPLLNYPLYGLDISVGDITLHDTTTQMALTNSAAEALQQALSTSRTLDAVSLASSSTMTLLEPTMAVELSTPERYLGSIISDLKSERKAQITDLGDASMDTGESPAYHERLRAVFPVDALKSTATSTIQQRTIRAQVPLSSMMGYASALRAMTQGHGRFSMEFSGYKDMSHDRLVKTLQTIRGF
jgi:elongation factor G